MGRRRGGDSDLEVVLDGVCREGLVGKAEHSGHSPHFRHALLQLPDGELGRAKRLRGDGPGDKNREVLQHGFRRLVLASVHKVQKKLPCSETTTR